MIPLVNHNDWVVLSKLLSQTAPVACRPKETRDNNNWHRASRRQRVILRVCLKEKIHNLKFNKLFSLSRPLMHQL